MINRYYFDQMNRAEQSVYEAMLSCFRACAPSCRVVRLPGGGLGDVFFRLRLDNPDIFYVTGCSYRFAQGAEYAELLPEYMFDRQRIPEQQRAVSARLEKLLRPALQLPEADRLRYVHDYICTCVRYDKLKKPYSHEIIGPLQNGVGVCEAMAKTVKLMCSRLGIESVVAVSRAPELPDGGSGYMHAWNVVKTPWGWRHLDATFDNTLTAGGEVRYDYFCLDDRRIFADHRPLLYPVPECAGEDVSYYRRSGLSLTRVEDAEKRARQALRRKRPSLVFHWRGGGLTRQVLRQVLEAVSPAAAERGMTVGCAVNWPQGVVKLVFGGSGAREGIVSECAGEDGELLSSGSGETPDEAAEA